MGDPLAAAVGAAVGSDEALRARVDRLVHLAIDRAEQDILTGSPAVRTALMRAIVPAMVKAMTEDGSGGDATADMRVEFESLRQELRGQVADTKVVAVSEPPVDDAPPKKKPVKKPAVKKKASGRRGP